MNAETLSAVILQIYAATGCGEVLQYQRRALEVLGRHIDFDAAWWGRGVGGTVQRRIFCSFAYGMPADVGERLNERDNDNLVARTVRAQLRRAVYFSQATLRPEPGSSALTDYMGIEQCICLGDLDRSTNVSSFISLARRQPTPPFQLEDLELLELLAPHLAAGLDMALADELTALRNPGGTVLIATDAMGWLRAGEPAASEMLRGEWPDWVGPQLPAALVAWIATRKGEYLGKHLHASMQWHGDNAFLTLRRRDLRDRLTRRERDVAGAFASGRSYREVAAELGLAPATVRHHLRSAYSKLGVTDKAALATVLRSQARE